MLNELKVKNFAIIQELSLSFLGGLNIISGETGAGKSIILKSLGLLMGDKADGETVRSGCDSALVEGLFDLSSRPDICAHLNELGVVMEENQLVVRRVIANSGKSKVFLNGELCALSQLREVVSPLITVTGSTAPLIEMTGQHDNRQLQQRSYHLDTLDYYSSNTSLRQNYEKLFAEKKELDERVVRLKESALQRFQRCDFLRFQVEEIQKHNLQVGEEVELESQLSRLKHTNKLQAFVEEAQNLLYSSDGAVSVRLHHLMQRSAELKSLDEALWGRLEPLQQAKNLIGDVIYELDEYSRHFSLDPEALQKAEERLSHIRKLQKKFGGSVAEILAEGEKLALELKELESVDDTIAQQEERIALVVAELKQLAQKLHERRRQGARLLETSLNEELRDLNMKGVIFGVQMEKSVELGPHGFSEVEFTIQSGAKDIPRPLSKFASGGELSRILLALKRVVGQSDMPRTYLFDEVDTGVSGETAEKVGRKLKSIAKGQQVICVTHLPQVASFADSHFLIEKKTGRSGASLQVKDLDKGERVREIARLISGEKITATSLSHAKELLSGV